MIFVIYYVVICYDIVSSLVIKGFEPSTAMKWVLNNGPHGTHQTRGRVLC